MQFSVKGIGEQPGSVLCLLCLDSLQVLMPLCGTQIQLLDECTKKEVESLQEWEQY